jgi:hypothetical protein
VEPLRVKVRWMRKLVGLATRLYWQLAYNIRYAQMEDRG